MKRIALGVLVCTLVAGLTIPQAYACLTCGCAEATEEGADAKGSKMMAVKGSTAGEAEEDIPAEEVAAETVAEEAVETAETAGEETAETAAEVSGDVTAEVVTEVQ